MLVIVTIGLIVFGLAHYLTSHRNEISQVDFKVSPAKMEERILGTISRLSGKKEEEINLKGPVEAIEQQAGELINQIKQLPQEQMEIVKERVVNQMCAGLIEEKAKEATDGGIQEDQNDTDD